MTRLSLDFAPRQSPLTPQAKKLWQVFEGIEAESCPRVYNFHMHTVHSDGQLHPQEVMEQAMEIGLHGMAITDHHSIEGYWAADRWVQNLRWKWGNRVKPPKLWTGVEINAELCSAEVHILGYAFDPEGLSLRPYLQSRVSKGICHRAPVVVEAIQQAGGIAILAHPARYRRPLPKLIAAAVECGIDGVEAYYAYDNPSPWRSSEEQTAEVCRLAKQYHLLSSCGTDTHGKSLLKRI